MPQPMPGEGQRSQTKFIVFENFEKMNTQSLRQGLKENELAWLENLQPIAPNKLTTVFGPAAAALATITGTVSEMFYADLSGVDYFIVFTQAGSGYSIDINNGSVSHFAPDGTFSPYPDVTVWQASRILIADPVAGYTTFDGTLFAKQGGVSPNIIVTNGGSGYSSPPPVTISGGHGMGAAGHSVIQNGSVIQVVLDNPGTGYQVGDVLTVTFGTGVGSGATGHAIMTGFPIASLSLVNNTAWNPPNGPNFGVFAITFTGGGGVGAAGNVTVGNDGAGNRTVAAVTLTAPGSGYTSAPVCTFGGGFSFPSPPTVIANLGTEAVASLVKDTSGTGYIAPPTVSIQGGGASVAATGHATLAGTAVNTLVLDTPGSGYTSTPVVVIGTGTGAAASAHVWPFINSSIAANAYTTVAVFQGRVWLAGGQLLTWSGTGATYGNVAYDDFLAADASGSLIISDADLVHAITALRSLNNYLWIMGDQSVKQIGNVSLNGVGNVTLFTILTLSSDQGTIFKKSCISYNRIFMFANATGIYGVFGSSVQKLSGDMDAIYEAVDFSQGPQAAVVDSKGIHEAVFLVRYIDPQVGTRSIMLTFNGKSWFVLSQGDSLTAIATFPFFNIGLNTLYGSSGSDITHLVTANTPVSFKLQTALTHHGNAVQGKKTVRAGFSATSVSGGGTILMTVGADTGLVGQSINIPLVAGFQLPSRSIEGSGTYLGITMTGTAAGLTFDNLSLEYQEQALWRPAG